jgi:large subunit ribosomal protein L10
VNRPEKEQLVKRLREQLENVNSAFLFGYSGLSVNQATDLRSKIKKTESTYRVLKNRIAALALESTPLAPLKEHLRGPLALTYQAGEPVGLAKVLAEFAKENPALEFRAGLLEGRPITKVEMQSLAQLPSREVLLARFLGAITGPLAAFQRVLMAPVRDFASVIDQITKKKESGEKTD